MKLTETKLYELLGAKLEDELADGDTFSHNKPYSHSEDIRGV